MANIYDVRLDDRVKGVPAGTRPFRLGEIREFGWRLGAPELALPLLVARKSALEHNISAMQRYCRERGAELAPHGKTTMSPQLFAMQLAAGSMAITVATIQQFAVCRRFGVQRVLLANQLVGTANIRYAVQELAADDNLQLWTFVDSPESVRLIAAEARANGLRRPFDVILEIGYPGGRTGVRSRSAARETVAAILAQNGHMRLCGVGGFEGLLVHDRASVDAARGFLEEICVFVQELLDTDALPEHFIITAGGSAAFDAVLDAFASRWPRRAQVVLRSGCYVTHDNGLYERSAPSELEFRPALELWSYVQSRPESDLAYLTFGRRDAGFDAGMPAPLYTIDALGKKRDASAWRIEGLNDQHARLRVPADDPLHVGDIVVCGVSHPCTTLDKWRLVMLADDDGIVVDGLLTFF